MGANVNIWEEPNDNSTVIYENDENNIVRAGTINKLVEHLTGKGGKKEIVFVFQIQN